MPSLDSMLFKASPRAYSVDLFLGLPLIPKIFAILLSSFHLYSVIVSADIVPADIVPADIVPASTDSPVCTLPDPLP